MTIVRLVVCCTFFNLVLAIVTKLDLSNGQYDPSARYDCTVVDLSLNNCSLTDLPEHFNAQFPYLTNLQLAHNKFKSFPHTLLFFENLISLDLSDNAISDLPSEISSMKGLVVLDLQSNCLEQVVDTLIPANFPDIKVLDLRDNPLDPIGTDGAMGVIELAQRWSEPILITSVALYVETWNKCGLEVVPTTPVDSEDEYF